jgi:hypothetical protein
MKSAKYVLLPSAKNVSINTNTNTNTNRLVIQGTPFLYKCAVGASTYIRRLTQEDGVQFLITVVGEIENQGESARESLIESHQILHGLLIPSQHHHQTTPAVLNLWEEIIQHLRQQPEAH